MNSSPGRPSAYSPTVKNPLQSATRNSKVREVRDRGNRSLVGRAASATTASAVACGVGAVAARPLPVLSGWATLQLSR